jgi:hypothetical protein
MDHDEGAVLPFPEMTYMVSETGLMARGFFLVLPILYT